jgi:hypothetical protein
VKPLQSRFKDDRCTFNDVINDVRRDLVLRYPDNPSPITHHPSPCRSELAREKLKASTTSPECLKSKNPEATFQTPC